MYCPEWQYFLEFVQHRINMRNNFQRPKCDSYSIFYNPLWPEHKNPSGSVFKSLLNNLMHQQNLIEQLVYQWKKLEEEEFPNQPIANPQCLEECCVIQTPQSKKSYDNMLEDAEELTACDSCPNDEQAPADFEIFIESAPTKVYMPHILFQKAAMQPTKLHERFAIDEFDRVFHNKSEFDDSHGQLLNTVTLDTG
ncbi:unnamed protein product [Malus baccata var. baccata]